VEVEQVKELQNANAELKRKNTPCNY